MKGSKRRQGKKAAGKHAKRTAKGSAKPEGPSANAQNRTGPGKKGLLGSQPSRKLTGQRRQDFTGDLRFKPVEFVVAQGEFKLDLEPLKNEQLEPLAADSSSASSCEDDTSGSDDAAMQTGDRIPGGDVETPAVSCEQDFPDSSTFASQPALIAHGFEASPSVYNSDEELLGSMSDDQLDDLIHREVNPSLEDPDGDSEVAVDTGSETASSDSDQESDKESDQVPDRNIYSDRVIHSQDDSQPNEIDERAARSDMDTESVDESIDDYEAEQKDTWEPARSNLELLRNEELDLSEDSSRESGGNDAESHVENGGDATATSLEDGDDSGDAERYSNLFALDSSDEENGLRVTLDDYALSDSESLVQDYMDNMSELDDDQIFALASSSMGKGVVKAFENPDVFDRYDEYDEFFDELFAEGPAQPVSDRKRLKRQAREAMHATKFGKIPPLWQKYPDMITVGGVLDELRRFAIQGDGASLAFPPLDNNANWYVKQLAQEHGMTPTVEGANSEKYVVVHRTKRTNGHGSANVNKLLKRRQFFDRTDKRNRDRNKAKKGADKRSAVSGPKPSARPNHGQVVGHNAAAIPEENFGHRLLVQMGWTAGSGLGRGKEGITAPVPATVKLTKTGLGGV